MPQLLYALAIVSGLELFLWLSPIWRLRKLFAGLLLPVLLVLSLAIVVVHPRVWTVVVGLFGLYRAFNLGRLAKARMHERYLHRVTFKTALWLMGSQAITLGLFKLMTTYDVNNTSRWLVLASLELLLAGSLAAATLRHIRSTREPLVAKSYADRDLPTLTVAVPARNETDDLDACLQSLVSSDYPKLEILVLDDCSSNAKTPEIIRSYAHAGVRFVNGSQPNDTWLAKNWAYEKLAEEANGELLLFCGVDTRFSPSALRRLVYILLEKDKSMVSVMPRNTVTSGKSLLIQPIRYAWELCLPRRLFQRPPVLSTCWLIKTALLTSAGGFKAVSRSIVPESHFARTAAVHDGYSFLRTNDVVSIKTYEEQYATAVRTRYPQLHRRPELVAIVALVELFGVVAPYVLLIVAVIQHWYIAVLFCAGAIGLLTLGYGLIVAVTYGRFRPSSLLLLPFVTLLDVVLLHTSMVKYEFSDVVWKGRNVCIPVMHVMPHLPAAAQ